jgi:hypothetical protein
MKSTNLSDRDTLDGLMKQRAIGAQTCSNLKQVILSITDVILGWRATQNVYCTTRSIIFQNAKCARIGYTKYDVSYN